MKNNDILICVRNGSKALVGKSAIIEKIPEESSFGAFMAILRTQYYKYIKIFLDAPLFKSALDATNTETINQITQGNLKNALIPLPPLAEQKRIVKKIEELMSFTG